MKLVVCLVLAAVAATTTHGGIHHYQHDRHDDDSAGIALRPLGEGIDDFFAGAGGGRPESLLNPYTMEGIDPQNHHLRHDHY